MRLVHFKSIQIFLYSLTCNKLGQTNKKTTTFCGSTQEWTAVDIRIMAQIVSKISRERTPHSLAIDLIPHNCVWLSSFFLDWSKSHVLIRVFLRRAKLTHSLINCPLNNCTCVHSTIFFAAKWVWDTKTLIRLLAVLYWSCVFRQKNSNIRVFESKWPKNGLEILNQLIFDRWRTHIRRRFSSIWRIKGDYCRRFRQNVGHNAFFPELFCIQLGQLF